MKTTLHERSKQRVYSHIAKHVSRVHRRMAKVHKHAAHTSHWLAHIWELIVVWLFTFFWLMHAWSASLPNNSSFSYPLQKVSTVDCRTLYWEDMADSCKISLPIIHGANYTAYAWNSLYRSIYTTLWWAPYSDTWDQVNWAHAWVDIATARGTPVYSIWNGVVYTAWRNSSYGNVIKVKYVYKWEIVYWIYAHLDTIDVKAGDTVTRWQKIGTTGNTWNTFGALWWYHLHFEIDRDNGWRPAYSYTNCEDVSKWHYTIIQNGLCRKELFKYQYDPIRVLEWVAMPTLESMSNVQNEEIVETWSIDDIENIISTWDSNENLSNDAENNENTENNVEDSHESAQQTQWDNSISTGTVPENNNQNNNPQPTVPENNNQNNNPQPTVPENNNQTNNSQNEIPTQNKDPEVITLDFGKLTNLNKHFMTQRDVEMKSKLNVRSLSVWETVTIDIEVFKKWTSENRAYYSEWVLKVPFEFINNNDNISLNINSLQLLSKWKAKVEITGLTPWSSAVVLKIWWEKIWVLNINVR